MLALFNLSTRLYFPISKSFDSVDARGCYAFDVDVRLPFGLGRVVRYWGWLVPDPPEALRDRKRSAPDA